MNRENRQLNRLRSSKRPTLKTVAQAADLAVTTVSRALSDDPKIAVDTRRRVAEIAERLGYVPDRAAQRLRTGKTRVISLILDPHDELLVFGNSLIGGLTRAIRGTSYHLTITPHFGDDEPMVPIRHIVQNNLADGVVISRTSPFDERARYLIENDFAFVSHGRTEFSHNHSYVDFDNEEFAYQAAMRLAEKGCRKICMIKPPDRYTFSQHMQYGLKRAVRKQGLDYIIPDEVTLMSPLEDINAWAREIAGQADAPDGFICPGEASYLAVMSAFRSAGKHRGEAYEVVVKSSSQILSQIDPTIDRIFENIEEAGHLMGLQLLQLLEDVTEHPGQTIQQPVADFYES